jgi:hypothetical protein
VGKARGVIYDQARDAFLSAQLGKRGAAVPKSCRCSGGNRGALRIDDEAIGFVAGLPDLGGADGFTDGEIRGIDFAPQVFAVERDRQ